MCLLFSSIIILKKDYNFFSLKKTENFLDNITIYIYTDLKNTNYSLILFSTCIFYYSKLILNEFFFFYFFWFSFLISIFIGLIYIISYCIINFVETRCNVIKWILYFLLFLNCLCLLFLILIIIFNLLAVFFYKLNYSLVQMKNFHGWIKCKLTNKFNSNIPPKNPNDIIYTSESTKKKVHKDIKRKAKELKETLLNNQKNNNFQMNFEDNSLAKKRHYNYNINIEQRKTFSNSDQLDRIQSEYKAYKFQDKKFKKIINDINKGNENFYPQESKILFKDYLDLLKELKINLKIMKRNVENEIKRKK